VSLAVSIIFEKRQENHQRAMYRIETAIKLNKMYNDGILTEWMFDYVTKDDPLLQALKSKYFHKEDKENG
jgi:hypothetical protein